MKLDLKSFKKVSEDNTRAVLQHEDGHQIHISKAGLNSKLKADLAALPQHQDEEMQHFDDGGQAQPQGGGMLSGLLGALTPQAQSPQATDYQAQPSAPAAPMPAPEQAAPAAKPALKYNIQQQPSQNAPNADLVSSGIDKMNQAYGQIQQGEQDIGQAQSQEQRANAAALQSHQAELQGLMQNYQQQSQKNMQETQAAIQDMKAGHIDPNQYIADKSVLGKVSTAIGLILGGIGGGVAGQGNPALDFLNKNIDRNIEAQKANMHNKDNIVSAYFKQTGNIHEATAMSKNFYLEMINNQLLENAAKQGDKTSLSRAQMAVAQNKMQMQQNMLPYDIRNSIYQSVGQAGEVSPTTAAVAAQNISRFPGGTPQQVAEAQKEVAAKTANDAARKNAMQAFEHLASMPLGGHLSPADRRSAMETITPFIVKKLGERANPESVKDYAETVMPGEFHESESTVNNKRERMQQLFGEQALQTPVMDAFYPGLLKPKPIARQIEKPATYGKR